VAYVRAPGSSYFQDMPKNVFFEAPPAKKDAVPDDGLIPLAHPIVLKKCFGWLGLLAG
jgi:hypothetical protein